MNTPSSRRSAACAVLSIVGMLLAAGCGSEGGTGPVRVRVASVEIALAGDTLEPGDSLRLSVTARDSAGGILTSVPFTWASADANVATASQAGVVRAVNPGNTTIFATAQGGPRDSVAIHVSVHFVSVTVGGAQSCALDARGRAFCWGYGASGALGSGFTASLPTPMAVAGDFVFTRLSEGGAHTCGVQGDGSAYCWGGNLYGILGNGTTEPQGTPVQVIGGLPFAEISAGSNLTCALVPGGAAHCWGDGYMGGLGNGSYLAMLAPVPVAGGLTFKQIAAGAAHVCALTGAGAAYCWGQNWAGQNGVGTVTTNHPQPLAVSGGLTYAELTTERDYSCGLTTAGAAYCWGRGALGTTLAGDQLVPVPVEGGLTFAHITAGGSHTCALTPAGAAYCWGAGDLGRLGNGSSAYQTTPVAVSGGLVFAGISAGPGHTCGVTTDRRTYCWGNNDVGQLGNGLTGGNISTPTPVAWAP